jgi:hypothetical protein
MRLPEFSHVVLVRDFPKFGLITGDVGVIVLIHEDENQQPIGYELEIFSVTGESLTTVGVGLQDVRLAIENDRSHARSAA